jgi:DNA-binding MarR family transcriptional regulator
VRSEGSATSKLHYTAAGAALYELLAELGRADTACVMRQLGGRRALLRALGQAPDRTVAEIARAEGLARQGVQRLAHALRREGLLRFAPNPRHRRAQRLTLTERGARRLAALQAAEAARLNGLAQGLDAGALRAAARTLHALRGRLGRASWAAGEGPMPQPSAGPRSSTIGSGPPAHPPGG